MSAEATERGLLNEAHRRTTKLGWNLKRVASISNRDCGQSVSLTPSTQSNDFCPSRSSGGRADGGRADGGRADGGRNGTCFAVCSTLIVEC